MIILPDCEIKLLSECKAGKLVRLVGHWGNGEFALVADFKDEKGRVLVLFQEGAPVYLIENIRHSSRSLPIVAMGFSK